MARKVPLKTLILVGTMAIAMSAGCGKRVGPLDPDKITAEKPAPTKAPEEPSTSPTNSPTTPGNPGLNPGNPSNPGVPGVPGAQLTASVKNVKNGSFLGMGTLIITVEVNNPSNSSLSGEVKVNFTNGSKPTEHTETKRVSLVAGETQQHTFENSKWSLDGATVEVKTDAPVVSQQSPYFGY